MTPDPKRARRIVNPDAQPFYVEPLNLVPPGHAAGFTRHHIVPRSQGGDDVPENLIWVDGSGSHGTHGVLESHNPDGFTGVTYPQAARALVEYVESHLPLLAYVNRKKYPGWLRDHYRVEPYVCPNCERPARFAHCDWCGAATIAVGESPVGREDRLAAEGHA